MSYDVIVVGLGGMGSAAAYHLAARGVRVLGLERYTAAHAFGSSHGGSRIVRQSYFEDPAYVPLLLRAYELWEQLERDSGDDILTTCGGLFLGREDARTVAGSLRASREWDLPHEVLDSRQVRRRFPTFAGLPHDEIALYEAKAGLVRPEVTVAAHLRLAQRKGAELHFGEAVSTWSTTPDGVRVITAAGCYEAGRLVVAPGAWAPQLLADLGVPIVVERQVVHWFDPVGGVAPFLPEVHPVYIHEDAEGAQVYGFPAIDGPDGGAKVAFLRRGGACTPETIDREVHPDEVAEMLAHTGFLPALAGRHLDAATCMYSTTPDQHFVVAQHPAHERVTVACGFSGHGFKFVPVIGEVLADLATAGRTAHPIDLFDPARPALATSAAGS